MYLQKTSTVSLTWLVTKEEIRRDALATAPPMKTVILIPILSTNIPAIGEQQSVEPNVKDPINATQSGKKQELFIIIFLYIVRSLTPDIQIRM